MKIEKKSEGGNLSVKVIGRLDTITAPELEGELALDGVANLLLDLAELEYVSSAGLRCLLSAHKTMMKQGGEMRISGVRPAVREVLDITGFSDIFTIV